jgi:hypothetical protein
VSGLGVRRGHTLDAMTSDEQADERRDADVARLPRYRAGRLLTRLKSRAFALTEPDLVRRLSAVITLGARPETDLWTDVPHDRSANLVTAWTRSGVLSRREADMLLALDQSTPWDTTG